MIKKQPVDNVVFAIAKDKEDNDEYIRCLMMREFKGERVSTLCFRYPATRMTTKDGRTDFHEKVENIIKIQFMGDDGIVRLGEPVRFFY